ncbi:MAG: hypothetical protein Q4G46_05385 [Propionibacteriaceae bacterium]|nr:hypothetical protein [Propionibacteriaceae bacterium]
MSRDSYQGPFVKVIGDEDLLQPTPVRIGWLLLGLIGAVAVGFAIGLAAPRRDPGHLPPAYEG